MAIPDLFQLTLPVLKTVCDEADWSTQRLAARLAKEFGLTDEEQAVTRPDGRLLFVNRVEWARTWLRKAGLISYPGPRTSRITRAGLRLLASRPQRLERDFFLLGPPGAGGAGGKETAREGMEERLEDELRRLCGPAVVPDHAWGLVRRLNGWGPEAPMTYQQVAQELGLDVKVLLEIGRACRITPPEHAPLLDAALRLAIEHRDADPDDLSLELAFAGITRDAFSLPGLAEAARRFGRFEAWHELLRYLSQKRGPRRKPRPFESWFELDVFLWIVDAGYRVQPQRRLGPYRVDMLLPDLVPQVVVECDGDAFHKDERLTQDGVREHWLQSHGCRVVRLHYSAYQQKPDAIRRSLVQTLSSLTSKGLQLRIGS